MVGVSGQTSGKALGDGMNWNHRVSAAATADKANHCAA